MDILELGFELQACVYGTKTCTYVRSGLTPSCLRLTYRRLHTLHCQILFRYLPLRQRSTER
jgi:hypothetical protein